MGTVLCVLAAVAAAEAGPATAIITDGGSAEGFGWPNDPPVGAPDFSSAYTGISFTGRFANYSDPASSNETPCDQTAETQCAYADTWYPSWAANDELYSQFADGDVAGVLSVGAQGVTSIAGADPENLAFAQTTQGDWSASGSDAYPNLYPVANLVYNNDWYLGLQAEPDPDAAGQDGCGFGFCTTGPFVGFAYSTCLIQDTCMGNAWASPARPDGTALSGGSPLFSWDNEAYGAAQPYGEVRFAQPSFVDFGKNMGENISTVDGRQHGWAYLVSHGTSAPSSYNSQQGGDEVYLARINLSGLTDPSGINDEANWQFYAGRDSSSGAELWTSDHTQMQPILSWYQNVGPVSITYDAPLQQYLMVANRLSDGYHWPLSAPGVSCCTTDTMFLEASDLTGPWRLVHYLPAFGPTAYFPAIPSKFISSDGKTMWLDYATWRHNPALPGDPPANPPGSYYSLSLHEIQLDDDYQAARDFVGSYDDNGDPTQQGPPWRYQYAPPGSETFTDVPKFHPGSNPYWGGPTTCGGLGVGAGWEQPSASDDAVVTWVAPREGLVDIASLSTVSRAASGGDQVTVSIESGSTQIWTAVLTDSNPSTTQSLTGLAVAAGDVIHFRVSAGTNPSQDTVSWNPQIVYQQ